MRRWWGENIAEWWLFLNSQHLYVISLSCYAAIVFAESGSLQLDQVECFNLRLAQYKQNRKWASRKQHTERRAVYICMAVYICREFLTINLRYILDGWHEQCYLLQEIPRELPWCRQRTGRTSPFNFSIRRFRTQCRAWFNGEFIQNIYGSLCQEVSVMYLP